MVWFCLRTCTEPALRYRTKNHFWELFDTGNYGGRLQLTKGVIMRMCKENKLCRYKENWKSILNMLREGHSPTYDAVQPNPVTIDMAVTLFKRISRRFDELDKKEMALYLRGSKGMLRHHMLHFNYVHRKIMELMGIYEFHREFPLLRTPAKIHALDDVMQLIFRSYGMQFQRTAVVQPPKCKTRSKRRVVSSLCLFFSCGIAALWHCDRQWEMHPTATTEQG